MRRTTLARWLVVGALAGFGILGGASVATAQETEAAATNASADSTADSGNAEGGNTATQASAGPSAQQVEAGNAVIVHEGDNEAKVKQSSTAKSGDAVAGSQVTGIVSGGNASVTASNRSEDARARSGDATATNYIGSVVAGPTVFGADTAECPAEGPGTNACIVHEGDNDVDVEQTSYAETGDAVAGSQVTGIVTTAGGSASVDATNDSEDDRARSGDADASNDIAFIAAGPFVGPAPTTEVVVGGLGDATTGGPLDTPRPLSAAVAVVPSGAVGAADVRVSNAIIAHEGDNDVEVAQTAGSVSGDAIAGSQVTGIVSSEGGNVSVRNQQASEDADARSGDATSSNSLPFVNSGPTVLFPVEEGPIIVPIDEVEASDVEVGTAVIAHEGDNELEISQNAWSKSGDAVAGSSVIGIVSGGSVSVDASNVSEDAEARSGDADATNDVFTANAGPVVFGAPVTTDARALDVIAGTATIAHEGDNELELVQSANAASGDAVAGGQVIGVVGAGDASIVASNVSEDADARSGDADATNDVFFANAGPIVTDEINLVDGGLGAADVIVGFAPIAHEGDNELELSQSTTAASGDAVAGGQVFGVVTTHGGNVAINASNVSEDAEADSGDANATSDVFFANAGPIVADTITVVDTGDGLLFPLDVIAGEAVIAHEGDNELELSQTTSATSGDAVAGSQVFGVVADGDVSIVASNVSEDDEADSGDANATSDVFFANAGPIAAGELAVVEGTPLFGADVIVGLATIAHEGDNELEIGQNTSATSGDAVAGSQVFGVVTFDPCDCRRGSVSINASNVSEDSRADSGDADAVSDVFFANAGPIAVEGGFAVGFLAADVIAGEAVIAHEGDNDLEIDQSTSATSGDAVAGGQVIGVIATGDVSVTASNVSEDARANSGDADALNNVDFAVSGPIAIAGDFGVGALDVLVGEAVIAHEGDNEGEIGQALDVGSGDAVAGGQVIGIVAGGTTHVDQSNDSEDDRSDSGDATGTNDLPFFLTAPLVVFGSFFFGGGLI